MDATAGQPALTYKGELHDKCEATYSRPNHGRETYIHVYCVSSDIPQEAQQLDFGVMECCRFKVAGSCGPGLRSFHNVGHKRECVSHHIDGAQRMLISILLLIPLFTQVRN
jgi:hypothetical protein